MRSLKLTRRAIRLGVCLVLGLSVSASTADAGVIPWLIDSLFGPSGRRCQPTYGSYGANANYGGYAAYGCPPASYGYMAPQRVYTQPVAAAPYYGNAYGAPYGYGSPCMPRLPNLLPALFGGISAAVPATRPTAGDGAVLPVATVGVRSRCRPDRRRPEAGRNPRRLPRRLPPIRRPPEKFRRIPGPSVRPSKPMRIRVR